MPKYSVVVRRVIFVNHVTLHAEIEADTAEEAHIELNSLVYDHDWVVSTADEDRLFFDNPDDEVIDLWDFAIDGVKVRRW